VRHASGAVILLLAAACAARHPPREISPASAPPAAPRTVQDGVYTEEQGTRGEAIYFASCVLCHRPEMNGSQVVPPLVGDAFLGKWSRRTAGDLFEWMRTSMPPVVTARLQPHEYADVLAYILSRNRLPAGLQELAADFGTLQRIRMAPGE